MRVTKSMTGFAALQGDFGPWSWSWDIRSVNARGLDIRLRLPDWVEGLEPVVRKAITDAAERGNVSLALRITRDADTGTQEVNEPVLAATLKALAEIEERAHAAGVSLAPTTAADIMAARGVMDSSQVKDDTAPLRGALSAQLPDLIAAFNDMRAHEGAALDALLGAQLDDVTRLVAEAEALVPERTAHQAETLKAALARVLDNTDGVEEGRVEQELALIAVKSDVREEIDRLNAHVKQARDLLTGDGARGRKLDFLMQEFNREANTLCSKAGYQPLTRVGLDLKALIDQMREQVQNVE